MKKTLSCISATLLVLSLSSSVFANNADETAFRGICVDWKPLGVPCEDV